MGTRTVAGSDGQASFNNSTKGNAMADFRIVVQVVDGQMAVNIGGPVTTEIRSFEFDNKTMADLWDSIQKHKKKSVGLEIHCVGVERIASSEVKT